MLDDQDGDVGMHSTRQKRGCTARLKGHQVEAAGGTTGVACSLHKAVQKLANWAESEKVNR